MLEAEADIPVSDLLFFNVRSRKLLLSLPDLPAGVMF